MPRGWQPSHAQRGRRGWTARVHPTLCSKASVGSPWASPCGRSGCKGLIEVQTLLLYPTGPARPTGAAAEAVLEVRRTPKRDVKEHACGRRTRDRGVRVRCAASELDGLHTCKKNLIFLNPDISDFWGFQPPLKMARPDTISLPFIEFLTWECKVWHAMAYN